MWDGIGAPLNPPIQAPLNFRAMSDIIIQGNSSPNIVDIYSQCSQKNHLSEIATPQIGDSQHTIHEQHANHPHNAKDILMR